MAYKIWKNYPSKKWDYSSVKRLLKKFRETSSYDGFYGRKHGFDREVGLLLGKAAPYVFSTGKLVEQTGISWLSIRRMVKIETLNSSST